MLFGVVSSMPMVAPAAVLFVALAVLVLAALSLAKWKLPKLLAFCGLSAAVAAGSYFALDLRFGRMPLPDAPAVHAGMLRTPDGLCPMYPQAQPYVQQTEQKSCNCEPCNCEVEIIPAAIAVTPRYWEIAEQYEGRIDASKLQNAIIDAVQSQVAVADFRAQLEAMANVRVCGCR